MTRVQRRLLDVAATALCVVSALFHTPLGMISRWAAMRLADAPASIEVRQMYRRPAPVENVQIEHTELARALTEATIKVAASESSLTMSLHAEPIDRQSLGTRFAAANADSKHAARLVLSLFVAAPLLDYAVAQVARERRIESLETLAEHLPASTVPAVAVTGQILTMSTSFQLGWPLPYSTPVTSAFGTRSSPFSGELQFHSGVDLATATGTVIVATQAGRVVRAAEDALNGRMIVLDHGHAVQTAYCHLSEIEVRVGQTVAASTPIGRSGTTGRSTGPHLHYQLNLKNVPTDPQAAHEVLHAHARKAIDQKSNIFDAPTPQSP
jgi:murein DD-endopeptidase